MAVSSMTVVKQKGVSSERYAKHLRKYINGKNALARGGWNLANGKHWFSEMAMTRKMFHHDRPARAGAKNITMLHQILAFLPEECSCNGGKMTPMRVWPTRSNGLRNTTRINK